MKDKSKTAFNILNIADVHFGKKNDKKLYEDLMSGFIDQIPKIIKEYDHLNMVVIEGDLFDRIIKMSEITSTYILKFIDQLCLLSDKYNFKFRIVKGTKGHDFSQLNNFLHLEKTYPLFKIITEVSTEVIEANSYKEIYEYEILYLPEEYPSDYKTHYKNFINKKKKYDFIFGHGMIDFVAFTGNDDVKLSRKEAVHNVDTLDEICNYFTIFGHIHDFKNYKDKDKIMYTGSFERFSFADQEDKGFLMTRVEPNTSETEVIFFENQNASTYKIINLSDYDFDSVEEKIKFIETEKENYDYFKVILPNEEDKELLKAVMASDVKMETNNEIKEDIVDERFVFILKRELPINESISKYIDITSGKKISPERINKIITNTDNV